GAKLDGANMSGTNMTGANMTGTTMKNMKMVGTKMMKANLSRVTIIGGNWSKAKLMHTKLNGIHVSKTNMSHVDFTGATNQAPKTRSLRTSTSWLWSGGVFSAVNLSWGVFLNTTLPNTTFTNRTNLQWATMENADFHNTVFADVVYFEATGILNSNLDDSRIVGNVYAPVFVTDSSFNNVRCGYYQVPSGRQVIGSVHVVPPLWSTNPFTGQAANGNYLVTYGGWSLYAPNYDWGYKFSRTPGANSALGAPAFHAATGTANIEWNGCLIMGVNAS
ncbi:MAG: pentapeptide repeat-containing protein, partial [Gaiellales bacterium]